jgi:hypothetical protein
MAHGVLIPTGGTACGRGREKPREAKIPQGRVKFAITTAPRTPIRPRRLLLITGAVESPAERLQRIERIVRSRCAGVLSESDFALVFKPIILQPPKAKPAAKRIG